MTRTEARIKKLKFYDAEFPCNHGHLGKRYVSSNVCVTCMRIKNKAPNYVRVPYMDESDRARLEDYAATLINFRLGSME